MRKFFCAFLILFCFSLFAQETEASFPADAGESSPEETESEKDLAQDYLAKSANPVNAVAWTRDGKYFATSWNNSVILWNAGSNTIAAIYSNSVPVDPGRQQGEAPAAGAKRYSQISDVTSLQFTSDGRYMLSVRDDNTVLIHSIGTNSDSTLINGTGTSIPDAVYAGDYRIILPLDGQNLYESFRLTESGSQMIEERLDFVDGVWGLSSTPTGKRILVTSESGKVHLIDTTSWEELANFTRYTLSRIKPRFAQDGIHFVAAQDQNTLLVSSTADESDFYTLEEPAGFSFTAEFSSDSLKLVAGVNDGSVKIYDIASGLEENSFRLVYGDSAKSLAFSPDGKYVIIGTEQGYIYRWVLDGGEFVPEDEAEPENKLENSLTLSVGYGRVGSTYYMGKGIFEAGYRNYFRPPFYWGATASFSAGIPGSEFPYTYYEGGSQLSNPFLYTLASGALVGLVYYNKTYDFHVFSEAGLGWNTHMMYNNSLQYSHMSKLYFGGYGELLVGLQWKWARLWGGVQYDTNMHWLTKVHLGVAMPTRSFRRKKPAAQPAGS